MARDNTENNIRSKLKQAGIKPFRYAKDIGKALLFDSLPNQFSESLPTFDSIYNTTADAAASISTFASTRGDSLKRGIDKAFQNESVSEIRSMSRTLLNQLKSGKLYDAKRSQNDFLGSVNDDLLDNFGGVDMTFDDEGEYIEYSNEASSKQRRAEKQLAAAKNKADDDRTKALMSAVGSSTEAQMKWNQSLTQASLQIQAKFHDESMNVAKNQLAISSATYELMNTRLSEMQAMLTEANKSLVKDVGDIKKSLDKIAKSYDTSYDRGYRNRNPLSGGFSIDAYIKQIKKNVGDSPLGMMSAMGSMLPMLLSMDTRKKDNPILWLTDALAGAIVPKRTKDRMSKTNDTMNNFITALLSKIAEKGDKGSLLGQIFGYKEDLNTTIRTAKDLSKATHWTGKDSKALTDVIPTQLAQIISLMSGQPMRLFDYKTGKFRNAYQQAGLAAQDIAQSRSYSDAMDLLRARGRKIDFGSNARNNAFQEFIEQFLNEAITSGRNINPYSKGFKPYGKRVNSQFSNAMTGLLKSLSRGELIDLGADIQGARRERSERTAGINADLMASSMIMAFSEVGIAGLDERDRDRVLQQVLRRAKSRNKEFTPNEVSQMLKSVKSKTGADGNTVSLLKEIRNILRRGIITYSYGISNGGEGTPVPPGFDDALKDARAARRTISKGTRTGTTNNAQTVGKVSSAERDKLLRQVRLNPKMSNEKLEEIASKLGYGSPNELRRAAEEARSLNIAGDNVSVGPGMSSTDIARQLRGRFIEVEDSDIAEMVNAYGNDKVKGAFAKAKGGMAGFRARISGMRDKIGTPFKLIDYAMDSLDSAMFKILYGDIPDEDKEDKGSVMEIIRKSIQGQADKFGDFLNEKFDWVNDKLFGKEGMFTKFRNWATKKLVGERDEEGNFQGGKFSKQANKAKDAAKKGAGDIFQSIKDQVVGIKLNTSRRKMKFDGTWTSKDGEYVGGLLQPLRDSFKSFREYLFGPDNQMTDSKKIASEIGKEIKGAAPGIGKGALAGIGGWLGTGLLTGMFLPGGPLLSGIIGSAAGLVNSSDKLKEYLFGVDSGDGTKRGGLISDKVQKGVKKFLPKMGIGAVAGATLGNLGILPFGLGNLAGGVLGSMGGMIGASDQLREMLFGKPDDEDSGMISKKMRTKIMEMLPGWLIGKTAGNVAWNAITNLGLIPGLSLLPGGPILGAMGGIVGAFSKEHIENFLFGKKDKDGKRDDSGIFSKLFNGVKDRLFKPLTDKINKIGENIESWFHDVVVENLKDFFKPVTELFKRGLNKMKKKATDIVDVLRGAFATVIDKTLGKGLHWLGKKLFGEKDQETGKRKGGIIRKAVSMPFQALGAIGRAGSRAIEWSDRRFDRKQQRAWEKELRKNQKRGTAYTDENGNWHFAGEEAFFKKQQDQRERRGTGGNFWETVEGFRKKGADKREANKARYEKGKADREARKAAEAAETPEAQAAAAGMEKALNNTQMAPGIAAIGTNTSRTNTLLEAIIQTMGGTVPGAENAEPGESGEGGGGGSKVSGAASIVGNGVAGVASSVAGSNTILKGMINASRKGIAKASNFVRGTDLTAPNTLQLEGPKNPEDREGEEGKYFKDLYQRADRAMQNAQDPRKVADELIANIPEKYSKDGIEVVNRVYELNQARKKEKLGGNDGEDTGKTRRTPRSIGRRPVGIAGGFGAG